jgi:hypothetical protein
MRPSPALQPTVTSGLCPPAPTAERKRYSATVSFQWCPDLSLSGSQFFFVTILALSPAIAVGRLRFW